VSARPPKTHPKTSTTRLDLACVERGLAPSRQRAQALILAGKVLIEGTPALKPGIPVGPDADLRVKGNDIPFVSRGGLKLAAALDHFSVRCDRPLAVDVGASTGGFTDCLLQRGTQHVLAVDVGYGQLAWKLRQDPRVTVLERTNGRHMTPQILRAALPDYAAWPPTIATVDVSFISLTLVLPAIAAVLAPCSPIVALVKPQFEAGKAEVGKGGVVRDAQARQRAISKVLNWCSKEGYVIVDGMDSPVPGPKGNVEHLLLVTTPPIGHDAP